MVYERQIATATRLIEKYGQACTWREPGTPTGNPANPTPGLPTDYPVHIVFLDNGKLVGFLVNDDRNGSSYRGSTGPNGAGPVLPFAYGQGFP